MTDNNFKEVVSMTIANLAKEWERVILHGNKFTIVNSL
jgi:hypothetical protein